jgi:hypothetical protein
VLGYRQRRHLEARRLIQQLIDAARAVKQRILGMEVKMNESFVSHYVGVPGLKVR